MHRIYVITGAIAALTILAAISLAGSPRPTTEAGSALDRGSDYFDVTTVFVAEEGYGGGGHDMEHYGGSNGIGGWAVGTTACNLGNIVAPWYGGTNNVPVIAQNCYRWEDGRFEQIALSWLKHSFCAVSEPGCGSCQSTNCNTLGVGCADTYWAGLNADADAPRSEINAYTGEYDYPFSISPSGPSSIRGRLQIADTDVNPSGHPDARYFVEGQYVEPGEVEFNKQNNNASYKEVSFTSTTNTNGVGSTHHAVAAIYAWQDAEPDVTIRSLRTKEVASGPDGQANLGYNVTDNGDGTWHYEYAVHNQNSHRSFSAFTVPVPDCVAVTNIGFHDVHYHSGEPFEGTDWTAERDAFGLTWSTQNFAENPNANAIRWATMYNFRFDADAPPESFVDGELEYYRDGPTATLSMYIDAPIDDCNTGCPEDVDGDSVVAVGDVLACIGYWGATNGDGDVDGDGVCAVGDLLAIIGAWGNVC